VALTGHNEAYYTDYHGSPQELISTAKWHFLYQGQWYKWQSQPRGSAVLDVEPAAFIHFLQNHDQVANSIRGLRRHQLTAPGPFRAMTGYLLLMPATPMLFQGQEFGASSPFLYFADHTEELAAMVREGRKEFLSQFSSIATPASELVLADPADRDTFERSKLDWSERDKNAEMVALHRDLIRLRRTDPVLSRQVPRGVDGAVLGAQAFALRYFAENGKDRLLLVNLGQDMNLSPIPEPLLAPPVGCQWKLAWSSENPRYGGMGTPELRLDGNCRLLGHATLLLVPEEIEGPVER
jgi:maltooligosyltrehalose trehalohydrolase